MTLMIGVTKEIIADNLYRIGDRIRKSLERSGRGEDRVAVLAVTKGFGREVIDAAAAAGMTLFGENRVQEAETKFASRTLPGELHLIGHLQSNKAKKAAALFSCVQSIDKAETAVDLNRHLEALGKKIRICLQLNTSGEASKSGFADQDALLAGLEKITMLSQLEIAGLMTIGPLVGSESDVRASFRMLQGLFDKLIAEKVICTPGLLSMGMSGDFEIAVEEGATMVRIGSALFGERE